MSTSARQGPSPGNRWISEAKSAVPPASLYSYPQCYQHHPQGILQRKSASSMPALFDIYPAASYSQAVTSQVPSALEGLTSVFGMGTGVAPPHIGTQLMPLAGQLVHQRCVHPGPLVVDSWGRSACYPRGNFYPLIHGPSHDLRLLHGFPEPRSSRTPSTAWRLSRC